MPLDANTTALVTGFGSQIRESVSNTVLTGTGFSIIQDTPFSITESCVASATAGLVLPAGACNTLGTGNFTVEWFQKVDSYIADSGKWRAVFLVSSGAWFDVGVWDVNGKVNYSTGEVNNPAQTETANSLYSYGKASGYVHIAVVRISGTIKIFVNGVLAATSSNPDNQNYGAVSNTAYAMRYGASKYAGLRISNIARYTAAFTPPSGNFDAYRQVNQATTLALVTSFSTTQYKNKNKNQTGSVTLTTSFSTTQYKNKNINQTGSLTITIDPTAAKNKFNINGLIDGTGSIYGTVKNKSVGVASVEVYLYSTQGYGSFLGSTITDASGNFSFTNLVVGAPYFVVAVKNTTFADKSGKIVVAA